MNLLFWFYSAILKIKMLYDKIRQWKTNESLWLKKHLFSCIFSYWLYGHIFLKLKYDLMSHCHIFGSLFIDAFGKIGANLKQIDANNN